MNDSQRLGQEWSESELIVVLDLHFNGQLTDSHGHDEIARCLGRYNPKTSSFNDGSVNQKLAEIRGYLDNSRMPRHPGDSLVALIEKYRNDLTSLHRRAAAAWRSILRDYNGPLPQHVATLFGQK